MYVLTSGRTFSAVEEFTYNLRQLERATIVGETTGGGAHPVERFSVKGYPVAMSWATTKAAWTCACHATRPAIELSVARPVPALQGRPR